MKNLFILKLLVLSVITHITIQGYSQNFNMVFTKDLDPTTLDSNGMSLAGTECNNIVIHKGKVWAAISYWKVTPPQVLETKIIIKHSATSAWQVEHSFGNEYTRIGMLKSVSFTTDYAGNTLPQPVPVLIAGIGQWQFQNFTDVRIASRNDSANTWHVSILSHDPWRPDSSNDANEIRTIFDHFDSITGVHYVFAGGNSGAVFRGAYDPSRPGLIAWDTIPELYDLWGRTQCAAEANGVLYLGIVVQPENPLASRGPLYKRIDGYNPHWELVRIPAWLNSNDTTLTTRMAGMRGITSVRYPGGNGEFLLCFQTEPPIMEKIEPLNAYQVYTELNVKTYFQNQWGGNVGAYIVVGYNDMTPAKHPVTGQNALLMGTWIKHPDGETTDMGKSSWYLIRDSLGNYTHCRIFATNDPLYPRPYGLRGTRAICPSPFTGEIGNIFYCGGFDQTGGQFGNYTWLYKGIINIGTSIEIKDNNKPIDYILYQNYPNPFNPSTVIGFKIPKEGQVTLKVFDILGREVATLIDGEIMKAGFHETQFSILNSQLTSGVYFYQFKVGKYIQTKKMMVVK
jgi:hypothetical protein